MTVTFSKSSNKQLDEITIVSPGEKIAIITPRYAPYIGGMEKHVQMIAESLVAEGVEVEVLTLDPDGQLPMWEMQNEVVIRRFSVQRWNGIDLQSPSLLRWLWQNISQFKVLHAHSYHTPLALHSAIIAHEKKVPFVLTPHYHGAGHSNFRQLMHIPYRLLGDWLMHHSSKVVCVSRVEQKLIEKHFGSDVPTVVIPNGVEIEHLLAADIPAESNPSGKIKLLSVGRVESYKQHEKIIEAMPYLPAEYELTVAGSGTDFNRLCDLVEKLGLQNRVFMRGYVKQTELVRLYRTANLFITLSRHEAFGLTLLEAAAGGSHIIASEIPAHTEVAEYLPSDRLNLIGVNCTPEALAEIIRYSPTERGETDPRQWQLPDWQTAAKVTLATYHELAQIV